MMIDLVTYNAAVMFSAEPGQFEPCDAVGRDDRETKEAQPDGTP